MAIGLVVLAVLVDVMGGEKDGEQTNAVASSGRRSARRRRGKPIDVCSGRHDFRPNAHSRRIYEEEEGGKKRSTGSRTNETDRTMGEKGRLCHIRDHAESAQLDCVANACSRLEFAMRFSHVRGHGPGGVNANSNRIQHIEATQRADGCFMRPAGVEDEPLGRLENRATASPTPLC